MVQVTISNREYQDTIIEICSIGAIFCMVVALLGIKIKWFKRRLDVQQLTSESIYRGKSSVEFLPQGVFRKIIEEDAFTETERPKALPPIRIDKSDKDSNIPFSPESNRSNRQSISQPLRPTIPPPIEIPVSVLSGTIPKSTQKNESQFKEMKPKVRSFQKNAILSGDIQSKITSHNNSTNEDDQNSSRRPTGFFPLEHTDLEDIYVKNYSQELGLSERSSTQQADPYLLISVQEKTTHNAEIRENRKLSSKPDEFLNNENEVDLLEKIRIPKPEPRTTVPGIQYKKKLGISGNSQEATEA